MHIPCWWRCACQPAAVRRAGREYEWTILSLSRWAGVPIVELLGNEHLRLYPLLWDPWAEKPHPPSTPAVKTDQSNSFHNIQITALKIEAFYTNNIFVPHVWKRSLPQLFLSIWELPLVQPSSCHTCRSHDLLLYVHVCTIQYCLLCLVSVTWQYLRTCRICPCIVWRCPPTHSQRSWSSQYDKRAGTAQTGSVYNNNCNIITFRLIESAL